MFKKTLKLSTAFSLLEVIFAIAIVSIIAIIAIPKLGNTLNSANIIKIKGDIIMIRNGLQEYKNKIILSNNIEILNNLESTQTQLFDKIISYSIVASNTNKPTSWNKISNEKYKVWIDSTVNLEFIYDKANYTFDCNINDDYCKELTQ